MDKVAELGTIPKDLPIPRATTRAPWQILRGLGGAKSATLANTIDMTL